MLTEAFEKYEQLGKEDKIHLVLQMNVILETEHALQQVEYNKKDLKKASDRVYHKFLKVDTDVSLSDVAWRVVNEFIKEEGLVE